MMNPKPGVRSFVKANPFFAFLCAAECLLLLLLCFRLTQPAIRLDVPPDSFTILTSKYAEVTAENDLTVFDPMQEGEPTEYFSDFHSLSAGAYLLTVEYESVFDPEDPSGSLNDSTASIRVNSFTNQSAITSGTLSLRDGSASASMRVWIRPEARLKDFQLLLTYGGTGRLTIKNVTLQEQLIWRWVTLLGWLLAFLLIDLLYCFLFAKGCASFTAFARAYRWEFALAVIVLVASLPFFTQRLFGGHDQEFHLCRIGAVAAELAKGQFPVRMQTAMLNGYGYANSLFYCDLFLYLPALLYNCMLPLTDCYRIYAISINLLTCVAAYMAFKGMTGSKTIGVACSGLYTLSLYRLTNLYIRYAVGEYTAMAFLPLIAWGLWNIYQKPDGEKIVFREYLPLTVGVAGIILCHTLSLEISAVFILGVCLCRLRKTLQPRRFLALLKAAALALGLGLWFLLPFLESVTGMRVWVNSPYLVAELQPCGLYPVQLLNLFPTASGVHNYNGVQGEMPLSLGMPLIVWLPLVIYLFLQRDRWKLESDKRFHLLRASFVIGLIASIMTMYFFPWDSVENWFGHDVEHYVSMVQFPWRYLCIAVVAVVAAIAAAFRLMRDKLGKAAFRWILPIAACTLLLSVGLFYTQYTTFDDEKSYYDYGFLPQGINASIASGEYLLTDSNPLVIDTQLPLSDSDQMRVSDYRTDDRGSYLRCENDGPEALATLPLFAYDNYHAYDQATDEEMAIKAGWNIQVAVVIPEGYAGEIAVRYEPPVRWRVCEGISAATLLLCCFLLWRDKKKRRVIAPQTAA